MSMEVAAIVCLVSWGLYSLLLNATTYFRRRTAKRRLPGPYERVTAQSMVDAVRAAREVSEAFGDLTAQEATDGFARAARILYGQQPLKELPPAIDDPLDHDPLLEEFEELERKIAKRERAAWRPTTW